MNKRANGQVGNTSRNNERTGAYCRRYIPIAHHSSAFLCIAAAASHEPYPGSPRRILLIRVRISRRCRRPGFDVVVHKSDYDCVIIVISATAGIVTYIVCTAKQRFPNCLATVLLFSTMAVVMVVGKSDKI